MAEFPMRRPYRDWTEQELRDHAQGCTELTCPSHGRYNSESAIRYEDHRDDSTFYGIRTEVEWDCSRCGTVKGDGTWEPPLVTFPARVTSPEVGERG